jgi:eukaryotic-like serine/threonine-protein kinase
MTGGRLPGYTEVRPLGSGATGSVVLATDDMTGAQVAVKFLSDAVVSGYGFLDRYEEEARLLAELSDPNLCRLLGYAPAASAVVMEFIRGSSLRAILQTSGTPSVEASLVVLSSSLYGLAAAHAVGVMHTDHKPGNVLVDFDGRIHLTDAGITLPLVTQATPMGTSAYFAPERWAGGPATPASDVYAASAVFVECLAGLPPYAVDDPRAVTGMKQEQAPPLMAALPPSLRGILDRGLAKDQHLRPSDGRLLAAELAAIAIADWGPGWELRGRTELAHAVAVVAATTQARPARARRSRPVRASRWRRRGSTRPESVG